MDARISCIFVRRRGRGFDARLNESFGAVGEVAVDGLGDDELAGGGRGVGSGCGACEEEDEA
jgi:hypothetical protein